MDNQQYKKATFAGGCFWCMVKPFDEQPGIIRITSGYTGGTKENPTYQEVCSETTGHREAVQIIYDPALFPYEKLVELFWTQIDPTDAGGQFFDRGESYKTAIYYHDEEQKKTALDSRQELEDSGRYNAPIVTDIFEAKPFYEAEKEHQDYYKKHPIRYNAYHQGSGRAGFIKKYNQRSLEND
ncbi:peptide-methionine (S)-S-oxide reductase MsrA [Jeotgalibacillus proteolyticus]|uniref:peptide-methionine (S)-S-oxide reductase MsrA n=1 Tax=Jeotgalibacillus proteolyticus TaxID=2082395 RepID=UPI003CF9DE01